MRQKTQSQADAQLRQALTNMRYKACTPEDLVFLRSLVSSKVPGRSSVGDKNFRQVSIITAMNVHKDEINRLGSLRFARETSQTLVDFFSEDNVSAREEKKSARSASKAIRGVPVISDRIQQLIWSQPPSANTKNIPGKLSLCVGLPVMIRINSATELCITKGQEATVHSWQSTVGSRGQRMLETLFVALINPPQSVKFEGLPENVVPLTRTTAHITCMLPDDTSINMNRSQVEVLPNFSMTDYSSQGKTRQYNVVDLNNSRTHQSYYTALSRSASAAGTLILQGFDSRKITGGASGALRQEFRELEILNEITRLRFIGKLQATVVGDRRNTLIHSFRMSKGEHYVPATVAKSIRWNKSDKFVLNSDFKEIPWRILTKSNRDAPAAPVKSTFVPAQGSSSALQTTLRSASKRKISGSSMAPRKKKLKTNHITDSSVHGSVMPKGTRWSNNSCAYDPTVSILYSIWLDDPAAHSEAFEMLNNRFLGLLARSFRLHLEGEYTLEEVRDYLRRSLQRFDPARFAWGMYTSVHSVVDNILMTEFPVLTSKLICPSGHLVARPHIISIKDCFVCLTRDHPVSLQGHLDEHRSITGSQCSSCLVQLVRQYRFSCSPPMLAFDVSGDRVTVIEHDLNVSVNGKICRYQLRGVVYHNTNHFTARIITSAGHVWFHDGVATGSSMVDEGPVLTFGDLTVCDAGITRARASVAMYCLVQDI
jgi:hypothetical protein